MKLKICGMKYHDNIIEVSALNPDYLGFIFYKKSSRFCDITIPQLPNTIKKTGVFVNASLDYILDCIKKYSLNTIQLHGQESPEFCTILKAKKVKIIKVFSIKDTFDFTELQPYESVCDFFLFDTKGKFPGGNGHTFDWKVLKAYPSTKPYFLSGGIGLNQINDLKRFQKSEASKYCYAIDVNSQFEMQPGLKNTKDLKKLIKAI